MLVSISISLCKTANVVHSHWPTPPDQDQNLELHIRHYDGGLFSEYAFKDLTEKTLLRIEGPLGQFTLHDSDRPIIMIAGGTGFAPIKSLIEYSLKNNHKRAYPVLLGCAHSCRSIP